MRYQTYFGLKLFHNYYQQQVCPNFSIKPTPDCQHRLLGYRMILKSSINGFQLLMPLKDAQQPMFPLAESEVFTFLLTLTNSAFISFTQLAPEYQPNRSLYVFSNETLTEPGSPELTSTLIQRATLTAPKANLSPLEARAARAIATLDLPQRSTIFGLVEIHNNGSLAADFSRSSDFRIRFVAKQQVWTYYLVANRGTPTEAFSIQDKDTEITFAHTTPDPRDRVLTAIQDRFPNSQPILLRSATAIPCREMGKPNLQLLKVGHTKPWIPHLPNPPNQQGTQVINLLEDV
ncbi:MAG: hypothetical protein F6K42_03105 [Leptolyngbya sp. SIO1D8]|nr:hypothetical protein [Leptolyngbya sp. SIO1D8]